MIRLSSYTLEVKTIPVIKPLSLLATSRLWSSTFKNPSRPCTFAVHARLRKDLDNMPTALMVKVEAARHGKLGADSLSFGLIRN